MGFVFEPEDSDEEFEIVFTPEPESSVCCFECGGELDGTVCHECNLLWGPCARLFKRRLDG